MQLVILHKKTTTDLCLGKSMHKKDASKMHSYLSATDLNKSTTSKVYPSPQTDEALAHQS